MGLLDKIKSTLSPSSQEDRAISQDDQSPEERDIAAHVRSKVEEIRASASRVAHESIWRTNFAYELGVDGISFNSSTRQFQPVNRASGFVRKNRIHCNKILPTLQNRLARLCKNPPKYDVRPESNSTEDKDAARLSLQVLTCLWDQLRLDEKRIPLYMLSQTCGHSWMKIVWDPTLGKEMVDPETGEMGYEGDIRADVVSAFEVYPDPLAKSVEDMQYLIHCKVRKLDYFRSQYPEKGHLVKEEGTWLLSLQFEQQINTMNARGPSQNATGDSVRNTAIEMVKYEKPSSKYPKGRMIVCANGVLLEDKELPCGKIPFARFDDVVIGGKFYPESIVTHLRPLQDQYNETIRRRAEWTKKLLAGKYIAARGSALQQESLNDESGELVYYTPVPTAANGGMPIPMQLPVIPQYAYLEEQKLDEMMNYISGISEVSRGTLPSASIPAIGMQLLTEQDDTRIGVMTEQHEHAWAYVGTLILDNVEENYVLPRKIKLAGKNLEYTIQEVKGSDLKGNKDVIVIRGSTLPGSKTLRRQELLNTYQMGLLGDPQDPKIREKVLGMLEFGDVAEMWHDYSLDMTQIKRGIKTMEDGQPVEVSEFDNHALWVQELNRYRKSDKFDSLSAVVKNNVMQTIEAHVQMMMKLTNMVPPSIPGEQPAGDAQPPSVLDPNTPEGKLHQELENRQISQMAQTQAPIGAPVPGQMPNH